MNDLILFAKLSFLFRCVSYSDKGRFYFILSLSHTAAVFGYNRKSWDKGEECRSDSCDKWWKELTRQEKQAAMVLCYDQKSWDSSRRI